MTRSDFHRRSRAAWVQAIQDVCGATPPASSEWRDLLDIETVLRRFMGRGANHAHLPTGGGLDFHSADLSAEDDCLEFGVGERAAYVLKPRRLPLEYVPEEPAESFLLLEGTPLRPALHAEARGSEEVLDLGGGEYVDRSHWEDGYYGRDEDGEDLPLPEDARLTVRLLRGSIMLVCKGSIWNGTPKTYGGQHDRMTPDEIRGVIANSI